MLKGQFQLRFVSGVAGSGKTTLLQEFGRCAQGKIFELFISQGKGTAYSGIGDPFLPFREVLGTLTGDVEAKWAAGTVSHNQALHIWEMLPNTIQAVISNGPNLIGTFLSGDRMIDLLKARAPGSSKLISDLIELNAHNKESTSPGGMPQSDLFKQIADTLTAISRQIPLLILLDDLQWLDQGSISLLFHLGKQLSNERIMLLGAYRSEDLSPILERKVASYASSESLST